MKLITWNTQWCLGMDGVVDPERIVSTALALADFDVLCLQEIAQGFDGMPGAPGDQPRQLAALLPGFQLFFGAAVDDLAPDGRRQRFGNLIATRLPVAHVQHHPLPWPPDPGVSSMPRMCSVATVTDPRLGLLRVMTTHLEYYSEPQRRAQARALRALHAAACAQAAAPPLADNSASPFQAKQHTAQAVLCGDFNFEATQPEYAEVQAAGTTGSQLHDAWPLVHGSTPHEPTFRLYDGADGHQPIACDFVFVSDGLVPHLKSIVVDTRTQASDHQPVLVTL